MVKSVASELNTEEQAASYNRWFRKKAQASRDDPRPSIPHDEAMNLIRQKLASKLDSKDKTTTKPCNRNA